MNNVEFLGILQRSEIHKMFFYPEIVRKGATDQQSPDLISVFGLANPSFSLQKEHQPYLFLSLPVICMAYPCKLCIRVWRAA